MNPLRSFASSEGFSCLLRNFALEGSLDILWLEFRNLNAIRIFGCIG